MEGAGTKPAERAQAVLGRTIAGKFLVESYLGGGAMGAVYKARQIALDKDVAIKLLHGEHAGDATFAARFQREAKAASKLDHPNSVRILDFGQEPDGLLYIAMEFLEGRDLFHVIREDWPLSTPRVAEIASQALAAIAVAHDMGVVHRDLKPENIMIQRGTDDEGRPRDVIKVCDFGIAKFTDLRQEPTTGGGQKLTTEGIVVGTPEYMSPEQAKGELLDARSDLYSVGVILYQMITGRLPFDADTALGVVLKHVTEEPVAPRKINALADERLEAICLRAMRKKRDDRYQSARDMRAELRTVLGSGASTGLAALAATLPLTPSSPDTDPHAATAVAIDSASVAAAAVKAAAMTARNMTPAGTAALPAHAEPSRGRGWLVALALTVVLGGGAGVWVLRERQAVPAVVADGPKPLVAPPPTTLEPLRAASADLPPLEPTKVSSATALARPAAPGSKPTTIVSAASGATAAPAAPEATGVVSAAPAPTPVVVASAVAPVATVSATVAPAPAASAFDASHAHVVWSVVNAGGGATPAAVQRALSRKAGAWTQCYRNGLQRRNERIEGSGVLHLTTDESGNVVGARINGFDAMPGVKSCIAGDAHVHFDNVDTGDAWADVQLTFKPE